MKAKEKEMKDEKEEERQVCRILFAAWRMDMLLSAHLERRRSELRNC